MSRKRKTVCPTCGQNTSPRRIYFRSQHLAALQFMAARDPEPTPLHAIGRAFGGTGSAVYQCVHELRHFGVATHPVLPDGKDEHGVWQLTDLGRWFLADWEDIPNWVEAFRRQVVVVSEERIGIKQVPAIKVDRDYAITQMRPGTEEEIDNARRRANG